MKKLIVCLFLIPTLAFGQSKKDTKISVTTTDTSGLFKRVALAMYERGYTFENKDDQLQFISTHPKQLQKWSAEMKFRMLVKDSTVSITGSIALNVELSLGGVKSTKSFSDIYYGGAKNSPLREAWVEMDTIARLIGGKVTYSK